MTDLSDRTMTITRLIRAPVDVVWSAWWNPDSLPLWWGPQGFSCRTSRIDLRQGGEWVFDMIGPDGSVYPNHHRYGTIQPMQRIDYTLHWGENGPKHADASVRFETTPEGTRITLSMVFLTTQEWATAKGFGAEALGLQTLDKLARVVGDT